MKTTIAKLTCIAISGRKTHVMVIKLLKVFIDLAQDS